MTTTADFAQTVQKTVNHLKDDAVKVGNTAIAAARDQLITPAREAAHNASQQAQAMYVATRDSVSKHAHDATLLARDHLATTINWAKKNPLPAIGIAFAVGIIVSKVMTPRRQA